MSSHGLTTQAGRGGRCGSGTAVPVCVHWLSPEACVAGPRPAVQSLQSCDRFLRSVSCWLFRPTGSLGSPALPAAIWECREEETWLPPGDNARENLGSTSRRGREPASLPSLHLSTARLVQIPRGGLLGQGLLPSLLVCTSGLCSINLFPVVFPSPRIGEGHFESISNQEKLIFFRDLNDSPQTSPRKSGFPKVTWECQETKTKVSGYRDRFFVFVLFFFFFHPSATECCFYFHTCA